MISRAIETYYRQNGFGSFSPKVVLFDMDGTLIDSMPNHAIAWTEMFSQYDIIFTKEDAYFEEGARGIDIIRKYVFAQQGTILSETEAQKMYDEKTRIFESLPAPRVMYGALEFMERLRTKGLKLGIVTGSAQFFLIKKILSYFGKYIEKKDIITAYDVKKGKPDPEPYVKGMRKFGCAPNETIVVENAPLGIMSGKASGAFTIALNTGPLKDELLLKAGADVLQKSIKELCDNWDLLIPFPIF